MATVSAMDSEWEESSPIPFPSRRLHLVRPPGAITPLVGRDADVAEISALLIHGNARMVSLIGPGGIGKTRLALSIASAVAETFDNRVAWVPVAMAATPERVAAEIAHAIGIADAGAAPAFDELKSALRDERILLVIDNFEQALIAAPLLSDLLRVCPALSFLVTSRALLRIDGERPIPVPPLSAERDSLDGASASGMAPAVRLFAQRAADVSPGFVATSDTIPIIAAICRRLDGLPLAIELAAERSLLLAPAELLARLELRLPQLMAGRRDRPTRHRTMRDAIAWSYDLLTPLEQSVLRSLTVFAGGCTLEAAEAVCQADVEESSAPGSPPVPDVVMIIESLVAQSLVRIGAMIDGETPRISMLQTIREFVSERLVAKEGTGPRDRHAAYFRDLAVREERRLLIGGFQQWVASLVPERANLRVAVDWALQVRDADMAIQLVTTMYSSAWMTNSFAQEKEIYLAGALELPGGDPVARLEALTIAIRMAPALFTRVQDETVVEDAIAAAGQSGDALAPPRIHAAIGIIRMHTGDERGARTHLSQAVDGFRRVSAMNGLAWALCELAALDSRDAADEGGDAGILAAARVRYDEAVSIFRASGYPRGLARALHGLAYVTYKQRDLPSALSSTQECLARSWELRMPVFPFLEDIADIAGRIGQPEAAARLYGAADAERKRLALPLEPQYRAEFERDAAVARNAIGDGAFDQCWLEGGSLTDEEAVAIALAVSMQAGPIADAVPISLSRREREVMRLLADGLSDRAIADRLFIGERTVNTHVAHIFSKLGVRNRAAAVAAAVAAGLVGPVTDGTEIA